MDDRLKREGIKSHKERVEELNRYLSGLSEHHDMYVSFPTYPSSPYHPFSSILSNSAYLLEVPKKN